MSPECDSVSLTSPLDHAGILLQVLNTLGPGHHLFISDVSKLWRESYKRVDSVQIAARRRGRYREAIITVTADTTLCSAVFEAANRVKLAHECGLTFHSPQLQRIAGRAAELSVLQAAHERGLALTEEVVNGAAQAASVFKLQWLHIEQGCRLHDGFTYYAARSGDVDLLRWSKDHGCEFTANTYMGAAAGAHIHVLEYLHDEGCAWGDFNEGCAWDELACSAAAAYGHLATLQWLHEHGCPWQPEEICNNAAEGGSAAMLLYLVQQRCVISAETMVRAAACGNLAACQFLVAQQCPCTAEACAEAAVGGHLETVRFLHENGCPWDAATMCYGAAKSGNVELLQYLKQQGCAFIEVVMDGAAYAGHTHVCQYLRTEQCPWGRSTCYYAAGSGHVDTLRWLHEQGCPWNIQAVRMAAATVGWLPVAQYLQGVQPAASTAQLTEMLRSAGGHHRSVVAKWLRQQGAEWPAVLSFDGVPWRDNMVQWARDEGCTSQLQPEDGDL
jgi:hypothetical protein